MAFKILCDWKEAVRPKKGELIAYVIPEELSSERLFVEDILRRSGVEFSYIDKTKVNRKTVPFQSTLVKMSQPYSAFAKTLFENQTYPNLKDEKGIPISPYDVTAHTISLLTGVKVTPIFSNFRYEELGIDTSVNGVVSVSSNKPVSPESIRNTTRNTNETGIYKSNISSMDEGWTRWAFIKNIKIIYQ